MSASLKILALVATSIGAILGITAGVVLWTLQEWVSPLAPVLYLASALLGVFVILGIGWFVMTRRELAAGIGAEGVSAEERALQRLVAITLEVFLGIGALAAVSLWTLDIVRAELVSTRETHVQLETVLGDPSPLVKLRACEDMFRRGWVYRSKNPLIAALDAEPAVAAKCLQTAKDNNWKGVEQIARSINDGWTAAMMRSSDSDAANMCELAPWSPVMSELSAQAPEPRLLHCATGAESDKVRMCCASTLATRGKLLQVLGEPSAYPADAAKKVFVDLVRYGFRPLTLSSTQQEVAAALGTDDESVRRWVVQVGCNMIDPTTTQPEILAGMVGLVEAESCGLSPAEEAEYTASSAWVRLCDHVLAGDESVPVQQRVCRGVQLARVSKAVDVGRMRVHEAVRATFLKKDAAFVDEGLVAAARLGGGTASEAQAKEDFGRRSAVKELRLTSMSQATCTKVLISPTELPRSPGDIQTVQSTDCVRYRDDLTVAEYMNTHKQTTIEEAMKLIANPFASKRIKDAAKGASGRRAMGSAQSRLKAAMKKQK